LEDKATKEDWDNYAAYIDSQFNTLKLQQQLTCCDSIHSLDAIWDSIASTMLSAAEQFIPKKRIQSSSILQGDRYQPTSHNDSRTERHDLLTLRKIIIKQRRFLGKSLSHAMRYD
jgi:hypothetical protein